MNRYEYKCRSCGGVTEIMSRVSEIPSPEDVKCSHCEHPDMFRKFGGGVGVWKPTKFN